MDDGHIWFVFGVRPDTGYVDIANSEEDVLENIEPQLAERICAAHNKDLWSLNEHWNSLCLASPLHKEHV